MFNRLVRCAVFTEGDAVMREHIHHLQSHHRRQAHGRSQVIGKHQEGSIERQRAAMRSEAVADRRHGVFAYAEMDVAASTTPAAAVRSLAVAGFLGTGWTVRLE